MRRKRSVVRLNAAAFYFVNYSRDIDEIGEAVGVSTAALRKWVLTDEWRFALSAFDYVGEPGFLKKPRRDVRRENPQFYRAREVYLRLKGEGVPRHKLIGGTALAVGEKEPKVRYWAKNFGW